MANVTIHPPGHDAFAAQQMPPAPSVPPQPSAAPVPRQPGNALQYVRDSTGRTIGWRRLSALDDFELLEVAGGVNADNAQWMAVASLAFVVREIDGDPVSRPSTKAQLKALIARLETPGLQAVANMLSAQAEAEAGVERAANFPDIQG